MRFAYRDDQLLVRDTVRDFVRGRIVPNAGRWSSGAELDLLTIAMVLEELSAGDGSIALTVAAHNSLCIGHLLIAGTDEQRSRWLPPLARGEHLGCWALTEPSSGSDAVSAQSRASRDGDGYLLSGTKQFITNGSIAGFAVVIVGAGDRKLTAFGIERGAPGFRAGRREEKMGLHASDTAQLVLDGCRVPASDRIGRDGAAFDDVKRVLDRGRIGIAALAIGMGRASLETAIGYAKERKQFGRAIAEFEMIQWRLARARTELDAARLLVHRAASLADAGLRFTDAASKAKLYASEAASRAADSSLQVLGGYGYLEDFPIERHLRDARLMEIGEGTSEVQRIVIARELLRID